MELLFITFNEKGEKAKDIIQRILDNFNSYDLNIFNKVIRSGDYQIFCFHINDSELDIKKDFLNNFKTEFKQYAALVIADYIIDELESMILYKILQNNYYFLSQTEKIIILDKLNNCLEEGYLNNEIDLSYRFNRKAKVLYKLMEFLEYSDNINVEGFITFRLKSYLEDLNEIINKVVEEYMTEKEYKEFIRLLKHFVNIQSPKVDELNIIVDEEGKYHFYDSDFNEIDDKYIRELVDDLLDNNLNYDDLLISSLITIAPKKIFFHYAKNVKNNEIIETVKNIFGEKVFLCNNCNICKFKKAMKEE